MDSGVARNFLMGMPASRENPCPCENFVSAVPSPGIFSPSAGGSARAIWASPWLRP